MNPGYLSWMIMLMAIILLFSGWRYEMMRHLSGKALIAFIAGWAVFSMHEVEFSGHLHVNLGFIWIAAAGLALWLFRIPAVSPMLHASMVLFLASVSAMWQQLLKLDQLLIIYRPEWDSAVLVAILCVMMTRDPTKQIALLSMGWTMAEMLNVVLVSGPYSVQIGSLSAQDGWWLSLLVARLAGESLVLFAKCCKTAFGSWRQLRSGWRNK